MGRFTPDSGLNVALAPSPNCGERRDGLMPEMLILHYTGMRSAEEALRRLCSPMSEVSTHYFVHEDGRVVQCVPELLRAWHAGEGSWAGLADINSRSIGIEIVNPGHEHGYRKFPPLQIAAVTALCADIVSRHRMLPDYVLAHSDVAPARKMDPGELFPWGELYAAGVGYWVAPAPLGTAGVVSHLGARGAAVTDLQNFLKDYGYGIEPTGVFDSATALVVSAFQRHFRPAKVDGIADASTQDTLARLLAARTVAVASASPMRV